MLYHITILLSHISEALIPFMCCPVSVAYFFLFQIHLLTFCWAFILIIYFWECLQFKSMYNDHVNSFQGSFGNLSFSIYLYTHTLTHTHKHTQYKFEHQNCSWRIQFLQKSHDHTPGWCGSVDWTLSCETKGCWFDSQSGHMPGLQSRSPVEGTEEATTHWCFPSPFSLPSPSSKNK